jgi:RNAse (barnase) inhibitor barstar
MRTISEFHYSTVFLDGAAFKSDQQLHDELTLKLGLPIWYGRNFDALLDCLSSIDDPHENLCAHWELHPGKRMLLRIEDLSDDATASASLLKKLAQTVSAANERLGHRGRDVRIWVEFA